MSKNTYQLVDERLKVVTVQDYMDAFLDREGKIKITPVEREMLCKHYDPPMHAATATQLAEAMDFKGDFEVHLRYGRLARRVGEFLGLNRVPAVPWGPNHAVVAGGLYWRRQPIRVATLSGGQPCARTQQRRWRTLLVE